MPWVFKLTTNGMANRQIARALGCAPATVDNQLARLGRHCLVFHRHLLKDAYRRATSSPMASDPSNSAVLPLRAPDRRRERHQLHPALHRRAAEQVGPDDGDRAGLELAGAARPTIRVEHADQVVGRGVRSWSRRDRSSDEQAAQIRGPWMPPRTRPPMLKDDGFAHARVTERGVRDQLAASAGHAGAVLAVDQLPEVEASSASGSAGRLHGVENCRARAMGAGRAGSTPRC